MKLLIIRHGESEADILGVHEGRADFELNERGHRQAEAMAEYVQGQYQISGIYCSTLKRAMQTAEHLSEKTGIPVTFDEKLMEFNNGFLAGLTREEADEKYPKIENLPIHASAYGMESQLEFRFRAEYVLSKIISENREKTDSTIAVITHGGMIRQLYAAFLGLPIENSCYFVTGDTGIHCWYVDGKEKYVLMANYLGHIKGL